MTEDENDEVGTNDHRITVQAADVEGIAAALGLEFVEATETQETPPAELEPVLDTLVDVYGGVEAATEQDSRGRSRKLVRESAGRDDVPSDQVGHVLRVLEGHDLVVQDGNRWRLPESA